MKAARTLGFIFVMAMTFVWSDSNAQVGARRIALVIGEADYNSDGALTATTRGIEVAVNNGFMGDLANPINDARDIAAALRGAGYEVELVTNANRTELVASLQRLRTRIGDNPAQAQVVVYYAGHALQAMGRQYFIPVGAQMPDYNGTSLSYDQRAEELRRLTVSYDDLVELAGLHDGARLGLLVFDACRNNPWSRFFVELSAGPMSVSERGMGQDARVPSGSFLVYSAEPGNGAQDGPAASNSPFTAVLRTWIARPDISALEMLRSVIREVRTNTGGEQIPVAYGPRYSGMPAGCVVSCPAN